MARTKQTARRTAGGKAPRKMLQGRVPTLMPAAKTPGMQMFTQLG